MISYSSYSKSPLEWMGEIPSHWIYTKNRFGFRKWKNGKNKSDDTSVLSLTIKGIKIKKDLSFGKSTESYIGHQLVEKGDIVFTPRDFDQTPILSDVSKYDGCISNLYIVDKTKKRVLNHYINYYWYGLKYSVDYFKNFSHGIRFSFNRFQFDEIPLLIPPLPEQTQIVSFLDTKTQKIDGLIEKTEQKIELLKEKRTSLINHCVTKGLNPNVEMKDSGVEWIGEIPRDWEIKPIKYIVDDKKDSIIDGPFGSSVNVEKDYGNYEIPVIRTLNITDYGFNIKNLKFMRKEKYEELKRHNVIPEDILFSKVGTIGNVCLFPNSFSEGILSTTGSCRIRVNDNKVNKYFMVYLLLNSKEHFILLSGQNVQPFLNMSTIKNVRLSFPPKSEQTQIVEYLDEQTQKIDSNIEKETQRIELLKEYRQSLISEVVTGKIDVRDWYE